MNPIPLTRGRKVSLIPTYDPRKRALAMVMMAGQMYALSVICEKELEQLNKIVPDEAKMWVNEAANWIGKPRRRYKREISEEEFQTLESTLKEAASVAEPHVKRAKLCLRDTLVQKISWQHIDVLEQLGFCGGLVICMNQIHVNMYGRNCPDYKESDFYLGVLINKLKVPTMNGVLPDVAAANGAIMDMFKAVGDAVNERLFSKTKTQ